MPPLPEFALELITRQKSGEHNDLLSPTQSIRSNESSERGWSSDPDSYRVKPQQSLEEAKEEWDQVGTVTAGELDNTYTHFFISTFSSVYVVPTSSAELNTSYT